MKLSVLHIVSDDGWGGAESVLWNIIQAQNQSSEICPSLIALNDGRLSKLSRALGVRVQVVSESDNGFIELARNVYRAIAELSPEIIHVHRYKELFLATILAPFHRAPMVLTMHGYEPPGGALMLIKARIRDSVLVILAKLAGTRFVAVSRDLCQRYGFSPKECRVVPNGIPIRDTFKPIREWKGVSSASAPIIGWVGRMVPIKGLPILLKAVALMTTPQLKPSLLLVGDGPERLGLEALAKSLGISDRVHFTGHVQDPRLYIEQMDVLALPSLHEGIPLVLLEAFELGIPIAAAAVGGIPEIIGDSEGALLITSHRPQDWADFLAKLLADHDKLARFCANGQILLREKFTIGQMVNSYTELYRSCLRLTHSDMLPHL